MSELIKSIDEATKPACPETYYGVILRHPDTRHLHLIGIHLGLGSLFDPKNWNNQVKVIPPNEDSSQLDYNLIEKHIGQCISITYPSAESNTPRPNKLLVNTHSHH